MTALTPVLGPSQGGTQITLSGEGFLTHKPHSSKWGPDFPTHFRPLVRFTVATTAKEIAIDGYETEAVYLQRQHIDVLPNWNVTRLTATTVPQVLNETNITVVVSMEVSFNRQNWIPVPTSFTTYDPSRIAYKQVLTIAQLQHFNVLWAGAQRKTTGNGEHLLLAVDEEGRDTGKLWIPLPAHGAKDVAEGLPIMCGSTIRLRHARTARNLHSSFEDSPSQHQLDTGS